MSLEVDKAFNEHQVVPDVIPVAPTGLLKVTYPSNLIVNLGNELTPTQVKDIPSVEWEAISTDFYTLLMVDPDAPSRADPKLREVRHWTVVNILGANVESGETLFEYIGSGPPKGTDLHRYVFLVYKQSNGKIQFDEQKVSNRSSVSRMFSHATDFVKKYKLGTPLFGNFYQAQYDDYVPILHAQLSGN